MTIKMFREYEALIEKHGAINRRLRLLYYVRDGVDLPDRPLDQTHVSGGRPPDSVGNLVGQIDQLERQQQECCEKIKPLQAELIEWAQTLPEQQERIIWLRNIVGMSWKKIAEECAYSERHCKRIHAAALERCQKEAI